MAVDRLSVQCHSDSVVINNEFVHCRGHKKLKVSYAQCAVVDADTGLLWD